MALSRKAYRLSVTMPDGEVHELARVNSPGLAHTALAAFAGHYWPEAHLALTDHRGRSAGGMSGTMGTKLRDGQNRKRA